MEKTPNSDGNEKAAVYSKGLQAMNPFRMLMMIYQFAFYALVKFNTLDKNGLFTWSNRSESYRKGKALGGILIFEIVALIGFWAIVCHLLLGIPKPTKDPLYWLVLVVSWLFSFLINTWLLEDNKITEPFWKIFDSWSKAKRVRRGLYLLAAAVWIAYMSIKITDKL